MIEWDSPEWGVRVYEAENGSWVGDKHDKDSKAKDRKKPEREQD